MRKRLEVIATTPEDAMIAEQAGADRIELIAAQQEGGLTPSLGIIEYITETVHIPVNVMVRPHSRHFRYDHAELNSMMRDIRHISRTGAAAIVTGVLTEDGQIDTNALERLLDAADGKPFTFHRAFDELDDLERGLDMLSRYPQITHILTSGGQPSVLQAVDQMIALNRLATQYPIQLIAGAGLTLQSLADFVTNTSIQEVHLGSAVRIHSDINLALDPVRIAQAQQLLQASI
ncbi:copper homeostasis protein CutC [Paenibacillus sp. KACC 21273]|uniref:copper homeostasis protein CutC n=1 Tax=Paenibacillus sp. KACC 21273 TaxID=3025665 RepID=UPI002366FF70|nr:copper homeostasis protein CutC [Paenibacillus sp. KACC 21273]WDF50499.1 copper homeostasis protein CutC [Paenibacillus sp. KACC 21273]